MERASELLGKLAAEESLILAVFGGPRKKSQPVRKVSLRPVLLKDALHYQAEYTYEKNGDPRKPPAGGSGSLRRAAAAERL